MDHKLPLVAVFVLVFTTAYFIGAVANSKTIYVNQSHTIVPLITFGSDGSGSTSATIYAPAIDPNGRGVVSKVSVQVTPGSGKTLTDIDNILFWVDTQNSIRTAKLVAENLTGIDISRYDTVYSITANASVIEGPSAGAALTIITVAALQNRTLNPNVMITGSVGKDGTIGPAGGLLEKARLARDMGATLFLVPEGVLGEEGTERVKNCTVSDGREYCKVGYVPKKVDVGKEAGINVKEVNTIEEAIGYFL